MSVREAPNPVDAVTGSGSIFMVHWASLPVRPLLTTARASGTNDADAFLNPLAPYERVPSRYH